MNSTPALSFPALMQRAHCGLLRNLAPDPEQARHAPNKTARQVKSGHYVEVRPTLLPAPRYVVHSPAFFQVLGLADEVASDPVFMQFFTGDLDAGLEAANAAGVSPTVRPSGWATGYALSIYGQEMVNNCPFRTGNGYGDGRAISVLEVLLADGQHWEFQLKGGGTTPYCRGGDGRAVLRSSIREFLASEAMAALGVPSARALCLFVSGSETVRRPWYSPGAKTEEPDRMVDEPAAITTRAAPSFLRVGQVELFGRRARHNAHPRALAELEAIFLHAFEREYPDLAAALHGPEVTLADKVVAMAREFGERLSHLVAHWIRVGYCQGNFNSDNCALGGRTLDYGPFGFMEAYDPAFQMWIGGGEHFAFMNQPMAAVVNFRMFCTAMVPLLGQDTRAIEALDAVVQALPDSMAATLHAMWAQKMGLVVFRAELFAELHTLMAQTPVDYTIFWRELSSLPKQVADLRPSFYASRGVYGQDPAVLEARWGAWLQNWHTALAQDGRDPLEVSLAMKQVNPKYIAREWMLVQAYRSATDAGDFTLVRRLQDVLADPYSEQSPEIAALYYTKKLDEYFDLGGTSHCSCSS
jgi:uncharacterized protein YdiU (UPF0061 family)